MYIFRWVAAKEVGWVKDVAGGLDPSSSTPAADYIVNDYGGNLGLQGLYQDCMWSNAFALLYILWWIMCSQVYACVQPRIPGCVYSNIFL